jgi:hypothetical protein
MKNPKQTKETRYQYAERLVRTLQSSLGPQLVFDIGAGQGQLRQPVLSAGLEYVGFDCKPQVEGMVVWNLDNPCPISDRRAGLVLLLEVVEHLLNAGLAFDHIADTVSPGGYLLVTTPNPRWSRSRLEALRTGYPTYFKLGDLEGNGHVFPVFPHVLEHMLLSRGFAIEEFAMLKAGVLWPKFEANPRFLLRFAHAAANKFIEMSDDTATGGCYAVLARKVG